MNTKCIELTLTVIFVYRAEITPTVLNTGWWVGWLAGWFLTRVMVCQIMEMMMFVKLFLTKSKTPYMNSHLEHVKNVVPVLCIIQLSLKTVIQSFLSRSLSCISAFINIHLHRLFFGKKTKITVQSLQELMIISINQISNTSIDLRNVLQ